MSTLSVCVPTAKRPKMVNRLLDNLLHQTRMPDEILLVDASSDEETKKTVEACDAKYPPGVLHWVKSDLGLTLQRNVGIDSISNDYICMLDDDVVLEPDCLEKMVNFLDSSEGKSFAGVSAYIANEYGRNYYKYQKLYHKLGLYDGQLRPGRWLYSGEFLQLSTLRPFEGVYVSEFLPAGAAMFRRAVISEIRPNPKFVFGGEDKHWTLRISQKYKLGVLGEARLRHEHFQGGVRKPRLRQGRISMRNKAIILRDCDPHPTFKRYVVFIVYHLIDMIRMTVTYTLKSRWNDFDWIVGHWLGWLWNLVSIPKGVEGGSL